MGLTFRDEKGAPLTHEELDENFRSFFYTASFAENQLILQRKDGTTATVPIGGEAFADFQENGGSIGDVYIADSQITGSRMIIDLFNGQFYDKNKAMNSAGGNLSSDEWYIDFDPAASAPYYVHFGSNFAISSSGYLHASGAVIEGNITATSGNIGGFGLTSDAIHGPTTLGVPSFFISGAAGPTDHFISASNFSLKGNGDITGSAVMFSGGKIAGWEITNTQIKKSTNVIIDANAGSITFNDSTFGNKGIQLEYNEGSPRFYVGDATGSFVKFDGTNVSLSTSLLEISASNIEISSTEASMSLGGGSVKILGASSAIEIGTTNKLKISGSALDAMIVAGAKTGFGTDDAGVIMGMDSTVPTLDLTKDANNYVRFNTTSGVDIKTDTFKLDTTYFDIDTSTQRLNIFDTASAEIIRLGEISDAADDLYGIKIFNGAGTGSANTIAMFGQQGNKIGGWEITDSQIRTIPTAGFGGTYGEDETGLIIHSDGKLESSNFVSNLKGWRIDTTGNGSAEFENMRIRGTLSTTVFEKETVNVVGGQLMVANATTIQPLKDTDGVILAGSSSYAANAVTFSVANTSGFSEGEILKIKSVDDAGFSVEYVYVSGSKRYSEDSSITGNTGSIDPDGLAGELYVERAYGGTPAVSSSITTLSGNVATAGETSIHVTSASGLGVQNIIKIGSERLKITAINSNVLTVIRDYHDTEADSHVNGDTVYLIDLDAEFLSGLVSTAKPYNEGQVLVSTGVFNPSQDISSGYIMMNANPRDVSTPYMDIVERTGSGAYDLQLRSRLGDLSGLASGYLYGNNEPGFGLYTENGFFRGAITAQTGSIAGQLHVATVAGGLETGQKVTIGRDVSGTNDGIYINNNNYWYTDGGWKVGGANNFISLDNFTDGNLVINTETFTLDTSTFIISSSLNNGTLAAGTNAGNMTSTTGTGVYLDGNGKFRVGTGTTGANYIYWDGTTLNIKGNIDITGGSGVNTEELNAATSSLSGSLGTEISASDAAFSASVENTTSTLDGKIFTDSAGRAVRPPTASAEGLYLASTNLGFYKDGEWKTYMDNQGDFFLTGSAGNKLAWDSATGALTIAGEINITSGNAATQDYASASAATAESASLAALSEVSASLSGSISSSTATLQDGLDSANLLVSGKAAIFRQNDAPSTTGRTVGDMWIDSNDGNKVYVWSGTEWAVTPDGTYDQAVLINTTSASLSSSVAADIFTDETGKLVGTPSTSSAGLYLGDTALGFYSASEWRTYMANNGNFYLTGSDGNFLAWDGGQLSIQGSINITGGNAATSTDVSNAQSAAEAFASASAENAVLSGSAAANNAYSASVTASQEYSDTISGSLATDISQSAVNTSASFATQAQTNAAFNLVQAGLNSIFRQNEPPTTESRHQGDMWIDQNDGERLYIFSGSEWITASDSTYDQSALISNTSSSIALDTFTDSTGKIVSTPNPNASGLYLGDSALGFYSASEWRTYMADNGNFFLTGSDSNYLKWDGGALTISGEVNILGGNAATQDYVTGSVDSASADLTEAQQSASAESNASASVALSAAQGASQAALTAALSASAALSRSVDVDGKISYNPAPSGDGYGLYYNADRLGFYDSGSWKTYMSGSGEFFLTGSSNSGLAWTNDELTVDGTIIARAGEIGGITLEDSKLYNGEGTHSDADTGFYLDSSSNFSLGDSLVWDGTTLTISGEVNVTNADDFASQAELQAEQSSSAELFLAAFASASAAQDEAELAAAAAASASLEAAASSSAAQTAAELAAQGALDAATGSIIIVIDNVATTASLSASAAQTAAEASAAAALGTATGSLVTTIGNVATTASLSASAAQTAAEATAEAALNTATGSLQTYADGAVTAITGSIITAQTTANTATSSAATAQTTANQATASAASASIEASVSASAAQTNAQNFATTASNAAQTNAETFATGAVTAITGSIITAQTTANDATASAAIAKQLADAATGSIETVIAATSSMVNPATYNFGPSAQQTLSSLPSEPEVAGLVFDNRKFGFHDGTNYTAFLSSSGIFVLTGSGAAPANSTVSGYSDSLIWNGTSLSIGNPGVGPSFEYNFSGSLDSNLFESSITTTTSYAAPVFGNEFNNNASGWDEGFHTKALFDRNDGGIFEWDIIVSDNYPATVIGLYKETPASFNKTQHHHSVYFHSYSGNGNQIRVIENGTEKGTIKLNAWVSNTPTLFRVSIQLKPTGAVYKVFKDGDFTAPYATYDSQVSGLTDRYVRPGVSIYNTSNNVLFSRMTGGKSLGMSTRISGNGIQTGGIQSTNWGTANGSRLDLDAGTFKLGGSASPSLSWDGASLNVRGNIQVTNPDTFATPSTKNKSDYNIILVSTGSQGTISSDTLAYVSESLGFTGGNGTSWYYDDNGYTSNNTNPANIDGFDSHDYDLYVFDEKNNGLNGSEIQLALNLFDLGKSVLVMGNDTTTGNYTGSYNTEWPIKATASGTGIGWMLGYPAVNQGLPASHPILAGISGTANVGINTSSDPGQIITQLKKAPGGGTIVHPFSLKGSSTVLTLTDEVYISNSGGGVVSFIATNPRGGRLVSANMFGIQAPTNGATFSNYGGVLPSASLNLTNFLLRTDPAIEAHYMQVTSITGEMVTTGKVESTNYNFISGTYSAAGTQINLDNGNIISNKFSIVDGEANFRGDLNGADITGASGTFTGTVQIGGTSLTTANTLNSNTTAANVGLGNVNNTSDATVLAAAEATAQSLSPILYTFEGSDTIPTSTNEAGADTFTFTSDRIGTARLKLVINDAEASGTYPNYSGIQASFNGTALRTRLSRTDVGGADGTDNTYFDTVQVVSGSNNIKVWSSSGDGGVTRELEVVYTQTEDQISGSAGGWTIDSSAIFSGDKDTTTFSSNGITISSANGGSIHAQQFYIDTNGDAFFKGDLNGANITGTSGTFTGTVQIGGTSLTTANTLNTEDPMTGASLSFNPNFLQVAADGRPAGVYAAHGSNLASTIGYYPNAASSGNGEIRIGSSDTTTGASFNAFPVEPGKKYKVIVRAKTSANVSSGIYMRMSELDTDLASGEVAISHNSVGETGVAVNGRKITHGTAPAGKIRNITKDGNTIPTLEDIGMSTAYSVFQFIYEPTNNQAELITNGDFTEGETGWDIRGGDSVTHGVLNLSGQGARTSTSFTPTVGRTYVVSFEILSYTSGGISPYTGSGGVNLSGALLTSPGVYTYTYTQTATNTNNFNFYAPVGFIGTISNVTLKEANVLQAKNASVNILNWAGAGTNSLIIDKVIVQETVGQDIYTGTVAGWNITNSAIYSGNAPDSDGYADAGGLTLSSGGSIHAKEFYIDSNGNANFKGDITGASGDFAGNLNGASITGGTIVIGSMYYTDPRYFRADTGGISLGGTSTSTGEFQVNTQGRLIATSGKIGNWNIGNASLLVSDNQGIQLDPANETIKIRSVVGNVATDKVIISAEDLDPISATKTIDISMAYDSDYAYAKRDSSSLSSNNVNMDNWSASTTSTGTFPGGNLPSNLDYSKDVQRADATTSAFIHDGGDLPIIIPIGKLDSTGTFRIQVDNGVATGTGSYSYNFYQYFNFAHVRYETTIYYNLYKLTAGEHGGSATYSIQSAHSQNQLIGENMEVSSHANGLKIDKAMLSPLSGVSSAYTCDIEMKDSLQSWGVGHPSQTINHVYSNLAAGSYKVQVILRTKYYVSNRMNASQIRLGTVTSSPGITWRTMLAPYNAAYTPVTVGTFTDQVLIGLNGVQVSGAAGSVVLGEVNDSGVASIYGDAIVTGTLTANTSNLSDRRLKEDILTIDNPLELIGNLSPKSFTWKNNINPHEKRGKSYGFIAQELTGSFDHLVNTKDKIGAMEDVLTVDQMPIVALNTAGIKALIVKINSLESKVAELEASGSE